MFQACIATREIPRPAGESAGLRDGTLFVVRILLFLANSARSFVA
jgi:hypothetical protein